MNAWLLRAGLAAAANAVTIAIAAALFDKFIAAAQGRLSGTGRAAA